MSSSDLLGISGMTPELQTYYSRALLNKLVPALQHADHGIQEVVPPVPRDEMEEAVMKWQQYFDGNDWPKTWDDGHYHAIITP